MSTFDDLRQLEAWKRTLAAAGFKPLEEPWSPYVPERPTPPAPYDVIGAAVRKAAESR